jgi:hypothetical protein
MPWSKSASWPTMNWFQAKIPLRVPSTTNAGGMSLGKAVKIESSGGYTWNVADLSGSGMTGAWAYEFWATADDITTYEYMIGSGARGFNNETILKWGPGGEPAGIQLYNGGGVINTVPLTVGWHHYVIVSGGTGPDYDLYVDGAFAGTLANAQSTNHGPHPEVALKLGGWTDGPNSEVFDGLLDELAIYDLSDADDLSAAGAEIASHYSASTAPFQITKIDYDPTAENMVSLTWTSSPGQTYTASASRDLRVWDIELDDGVPAGDGETTTLTFDLKDAGLAEEDDLFFRVTRN